MTPEQYAERAAGGLTRNGFFEREISRTSDQFGAVTHLFGAVNFELFGRLNNVIDERNEWFDRQLRDLAASMGLSPRR